MANMCMIHIAITCETRAEAEELCRKLYDYQAGDTLTLKTPDRPIFGVDYGAIQNVVHIDGEVRWGFSDIELSVAMNLLLSLSNKIDKISVTYQELGTAMYGIVTTTPDDNFMEDRYIEDAYLCGALRALAVCHDCGYITDQDWSEAEDEFCRQAIQETPYIGTRSINRGWIGVPEPYDNA